MLRSSCFILLLFFWLAVDSAVGDSPTFDEQNHIARGMSFLETGDPRLSLEHPPLINVWSASPLLTMGLDVPVESAAWEESQWYLFGEELLWERNGERVEAIVFMARVPVILLTMGLGVICFHWARRWWGAWAGVVTMGLVLFDPNVMAHGRLSTTDLGGTVMVVGASYLVWKMAMSGRWRDVVLAGGGMGLAFGSKLSALGFVFIWFGGVVWMWLSAKKGRLNRRGAERTGEFNHRSAEEEEKRWEFLRMLVQYVLAGCVAVFVVWAVFGFEWGRGVFLGEALQGLNGVSLPLPTFWAGIERIAGATGGGREAFLWGEYSKDGFWNYFLVAFLVKTPLVVIGAVGYAVGDFVLNRRYGRKTFNRRGAEGTEEFNHRGTERVLVVIGAVGDFVLNRRYGGKMFNRRGGEGTEEFNHRETERIEGSRGFLVVVAAGYFLLTLGSGLNIGYRHLLPMLPFLYLLIGGLMGRGIVGRCVAIGVLVCSMVTAVWVHPHYLSYFNRVAGGSMQGWEVLVDSNVDWGQDLYRLRDWMVENEVDSVKLGWFGASMAPDVILGSREGAKRLSYEPLPGKGGAFEGLWFDVPFDVGEPEAGVYAISVHNFQEMQRRYFGAEADVYSWFRAREPDVRIGYSIYVYIVE